jgi:hypothetical protein
LIVDSIGHSRQAAVLMPRCRIGTKLYKALNLLETKKWLIYRISDTEPWIRPQFYWENYTHYCCLMIFSGRTAVIRFYVEDTTF